MTQVSAKTVVVLELDLTQRLFNVLIQCQKNKQKKFYFIKNIETNKPEGLSNKTSTSEKSSNQIKAFVLAFSIFHNSKLYSLSLFIVEIASFLLFSSVKFFIGFFYYVIYFFFDWISLYHNLTSMFKFTSWYFSVVNLVSRTTNQNHEIPWKAFSSPFSLEKILKL